MCFPFTEGCEKHGRKKMLDKDVVVNANVSTNSIKDEVDVGAGV